MPSLFPISNGYPYINSLSVFMSSIGSNRSFSNWSSLLLLGGVLCDFNHHTPGLCSPFESTGLRWKWAFHRILFIKSTLLFVKDRTKSCFFREYFGVILFACMFNQYLLSLINGVLNVLQGAIFLQYPVSVQRQWVWIMFLLNIWGISYKSMWVLNVWLLLIPYSFAEI